MKPLNQIIIEGTLAWLQAMNEQDWDLDKALKELQSNKGTECEEK